MRDRDAAGMTGRTYVRESEKKTHNFVIPGHDGMTWTSAQDISV